MSTALAVWQNQYVAKKAMFSLLGNAFRLYAADGSLAFFVKQKAFRLKEEIVVFADEKQSTPRLRINARSILDFGATYDITDPDGSKIGACRREGLKSMFRDSWLVLDTNDQTIATIKEDSMLMALLRRMLLPIIPQRFTVADTTGKEIGTLRQRFNIFQLGYDVHFEGLDPRIGVAATVLLLAIEGRQK